MKTNKVSLETDIKTNGLIISFGICILIIFISILLLYLSTPPQKIYTARVNGSPITNDEFNNGVERMKNQYIQVMHTDFTSPDGKQLLENIEKQTLNSLVDREILLQAAKKMDISVESSEIDDEINDIKAKNYNNDEKAFKEALKTNNLPMSKLKEGIEKDKLVKKVRDKIVEERIVISDKEKKEYFKTNKAEFTQAAKVKASHILVKDEKLANDIYTQIKNGAKFEDLAKKHSIDTGSKVVGGDLGFFEKGKMVPEFEKAVWNLKVGELSPPVKSQFGYHIIKKTGEQPEKVTDYNVALKSIIAKIKEKRSQEVIDKFIKEEKEKSKVEIFVARLAETPAPSIVPAGKDKETKTGSTTGTQSVTINGTESGPIKLNIKDSKVNTKPAPKKEGKN
jgi:foldase protein PrsA